MQLNQKAIVEHDGELFTVEANPDEDSFCPDRCDLRRKCLSEAEDINTPGLIMNRCGHMFGEHAYLKKITPKN